MNSGKILLIDDDAQLRRTLRLIIQNQGFQVLEAENEAEGVSLAEQNNPRLIICDVNMTQGDGYSTLERLRQNPVTALIPFILMTGRPSDVGMRRGMAGGADDYLEKPFNADSLIATVRARLRKKELLSAQAKQTEARLVATLEATPDLVAITDKNEKCVYLNHAGRRMLGIGETEKLTDFHVEKLISRLALTSPEPDAAAALLRDGMWSGESVLCSRAGREIPISHLILSNQIDGALQFHSIFARDISERKMAEALMRESNQRLQMLSANLVNIQEMEKRHLARELHDEIGQALTATKINLEGALQLAPEGPLAVRLGKSVAVLDRLLQQVRNMSLDLGPPLLDDLGLVPALRWYMDQWSQRTGISARFSADSKLERMDSSIETACFRVAQEALTNVIRHAHATNVLVKIICENKTLFLSISDDGVGFNWLATRARAQRGSGLGLLGMEERVSLVGGTLRIESQPEQGTRIMACFPFLGSPIEAPRN